MHHTSASHKHIRGCILTRNMSEKCPKASPAFLFGEPPEFATEIIDLTWQKPRMSLDDSNPLPPFPLIEHKSVITACSRWECYYKAIYQERGVDGVLSLDGEVSLGYRGRFDVNFMLRCSLEWLMAQKNRQLNSCRYFSRNVSIFQNDVLLSKVEENGPNVVSDIKLVTWGQLPPFSPATSLTQKFSPLLNRWGAMLQENWTPPVEEMISNWQGSSSLFGFPLLKTQLWLRSP